MTGTHSVFVHVSGPELAFNQLDIWPAYRADAKALFKNNLRFVRGNERDDVLLAPNNARHFSLVFIGLLEADVVEAANFVQGFCNFMIIHMIMSVIYVYYIVRDDSELSE